MAFDYLAAKKAGHSDQEIDSYLKQKTGKAFDFNSARKAGYDDKAIQKELGSAQPTSEQQSQQPQDFGFIGDIIHGGSDLLRNIGLGILPNAAASVTNIPAEIKGTIGRLQGDPNAAAEAYKTMQQNPLSDPKMIQQQQQGDVLGILQGGQSDLQNAIGTLAGGMGFKNAVKDIPAVAKAVIHPLNTVGAKIGGMAEKAGEIPAGTLEQRFGTFRNPNPDILARQGTGADIYKKGGLRDILKQEIMSQGRSPGGNIPQPTFKDILDRRIGSYKGGWDENVPKVQQGLQKQIGRAYSDILHEKVPEMKKWDQLYHALSVLETKIPGIAKLLGISGGAYEAVNLIRK